MNWAISYRLRHPGFWLLAAVSACAPAIPLVAGDAIVFGSAKSAAEPNKDRIQGHSPLNLEKLTAPAPIDFGGIMPIAPRLDVNPRKDKRQRNAEDEKRNWMFLEKGEAFRRNYFALIVLVLLSTKSNGQKKFSYRGCFRCW